MKEKRMVRGVEQKAKRLKDFGKKEQIKKVKNALRN